MKPQYTLTAKDFVSIRDRLYKQTGISLADSKDAMVYSRLSRRITALSLQSFSEYLAYIDANSSEMVYFIDALTTNKTSFFREMHHFEFLKSWMAKQKRLINIWCAACSSGEEPYSIAMTCAAVQPNEFSNYHVYSSDISETMLDKAQQAKYPVSMLESIPSDYLKRYCQRGKSSQDGFFRINPSLSASVTVFSQNLLDDEWRVPKPLDIVFCRNVMIYFDKKTQTKLLSRFEKILRPGGLYFAGHSESVAQFSDAFEPLGQTIYQKAALS